MFRVWFRSLAAVLGVGGVLLIGSATASAQYEFGSGSVSNIRSAGYGTYSYTISATASSRVCTTYNYCGWFPVAYVFPANQQCSASSYNGTYAWVGTNQSQPGTQTSNDSAYMPGDPPWRFCIYVYSQGTYQLVHDQIRSPDGYEPPPPEPPQPPDWTGMITIGRLGGAALDLNPSTLGAQGVSSARFESMVRRTAPRWDLDIGFITFRPTQPVRSPDGQYTLGFSRSLSNSVLGVVTEWTKNNYRRKCSWRNGRRKCRKVVVSYTVYDQDLSLNANLNWQQGPAYPNSRQFDLETILIHEMGHVAGNTGHITGCQNNPMSKYTQAGEWWRSPTDWRRFGCSNSRVASAANEGPAGEGAVLRHITRDVGSGEIVDLEGIPRD